MSIAVLGMVAHTRPIDALYAVSVVSHFHNRLVLEAAIV